MKHLIVVSHPAERSFTMALANAYAAELDDLGQEQQTHDLYRMGFNPVLAANELEPLDRKHPPDADVARVQDDVRAADVLVVIYPLWWMSMPAIMKGYIDRVFARGFAYESESGVVRGLLYGKKCILVTLSGAPLPVLVGSGSWNAVLALQDGHVFRSAGFELLEHVHFDEVVPGLSKRVAERHLARIRSCARQHFAVARQSSGLQRGGATPKPIERE
jgi:NAD(P)H dehydrogenase (quinone)